MPDRLIRTNEKATVRPAFIFRQCIALGLQPCDANSFSDADSFSNANSFSNADSFSNAYPSADN